MTERDFMRSSLLLQYPALAAGQTFVYTLTADVVRDGETLTSVQKITVRAGEQTNVSLPVEQFAATLAMR